MENTAKWTKVLGATVLAMVAPLVIATGVSANQLTFSVTPVLPDNQIDKTDGFFNLKLDQGASEDLMLHYANNTKQPIEVSTSVAPASTNQNGVVEYGPNTIKPDVSLKYNMKDLVNVPDKVDLNAGKTKDVPVHVTMPNAQVPGIIAGGLTFSDKAADKANESTKSKGTSIKNIYSFQLGLLMRESTDAPYKDQMLLENGLKLKSVKPTQVNYRNVIAANLQNPDGIYLNNFAVDAKVMKANKSKVLYESKNNSMQMAPNTNFDYSVPLGDGTRMKPGKYKLDLTAYADKDNTGAFKTAMFGEKTDYRYSWHFTKTFTIAGATAKRLNKRDVTIKPFNWLLAAVIAVVIALLLLLLLLKRRRDNEKITIEEMAESASGEQVKIVREVNQAEYRRLKKQGHVITIVSHNAK